MTDILMGMSFAAALIGGWGQAASFVILAEREAELRRTGQVEVEPIRYFPWRFRASDVLIALGYSPSRCADAAALGAAMGFKMFTVLMLAGFLGFLGTALAGHVF